MEEESFRQLEYGGEFVPEEVPDGRLMSRSIRLAGFIKSQEFEDLKLIINTVVGRYAVPVARRPEDERAYQLFNNVRDVMNELMMEVLDVAAVSQKG